MLDREATIRQDAQKRLRKEVEMYKQEEIEYKKEIEKYSKETTEDSERKYKLRHAQEMLEETVNARKSVEEILIRMEKEVKDLLQGKAPL